MSKHNEAMYLYSITTFILRQAFLVLLHFKE